MNFLSKNQNLYFTEFVSFTNILYVLKMNFLKKNTNNESKLMYFSKFVPFIIDMLQKLLY